MDIYTAVSYSLCRKFTLAYSSSFSMSSSLFDRSIRKHVYALYALVRVADEIVDSYQGDETAKQELLDALETEVYAAAERQYSANPFIHAFAETAERYGIDSSLLGPFFKSMRMDIGNQYQQENYVEYIYGSAEVVGLMCLKIFCDGDAALYDKLTKGARILGSAYQKVNFLRDFATDYTELGRVYLPGVSYETFSNEQKDAIVQEIELEFSGARNYIDQLPQTAQKAVRTSWVYYGQLLKVIAATPVQALKMQRVRVSMPRKLWLLAKVKLGVKT